MAKTVKTHQPRPAPLRKRTSIGRYAKVLNKSARLARGKKVYRGQGC